MLYQYINTYTITTKGENIIFFISTYTEFLFLLVDPPSHGSHQKNPIALLTVAIICLVIVHNIIDTAWKALCSEVIRELIPDIKKYV